jgi:hypothetical protein
MASKFGGCGGRFRFAAVMLLVGVSAAQAPIVPTDHYGPPTCPGVKPSSHHSSAEKILEEQELGAQSDHALLAAEPLENFAIQRARLADYADCVVNGVCYWADLDAQYKRAEVALKEKEAAAKPGAKLAIVMDIDETSLSGYCEMQRENYGYIGSMFNSWVVSPDASVAIPGALRLFHEAKAAGVAVFFITGRPGVPDYSAAVPAADQTEATARNLETAGFHGWAGLALRKGGENLMPTIDYKSEERHRITDQGYTIVMSVGDQWSDLLGEPQAELSVKLPNPFYFLP